MCLPVCRQPIVSIWAKGDVQQRCSHTQAPSLHRGCKNVQLWIVFLYTLLYFLDPRENISINAYLTSQEVENDTWPPHGSSAHQDQQPKSQTKSAPPPTESEQAPTKKRRKYSKKSKNSSSEVLVWILVAHMDASALIQLTRPPRLAFIVLILFYSTNLWYFHLIVAVTIGRAPVGNPSGHTTEFRSHFHSQVQHSFEFGLNGSL